VKPVQKRGSEAAYSFVMTFANGDDLDWEFAFVRTLGIPTGENPEDLMPTKRRKRVQDLPVLHPDAAGIDVGANELFVAVPADRDSEPVRSFATFTRDLHVLADWLKRSATFNRSRWNPPVFIGYRSIRF
jgi:hypothetical protein